MTEEHRRLLAELPRTPYGVALRVLLEEEKQKIDSVTACTSWEDTLGRKHALSLIEGMFLFMRDKEDTKRTQNQYE